MSSSIQMMVVVRYPDGSKASRCGEVPANIGNVDSLLRNGLIHLCGEVLREHYMLINGDQAGRILCLNQKSSVVQCSSPKIDSVCSSPSSCAQASEDGPTESSGYQEGVHFWPS